MILSSESIAYLFYFYFLFYMNKETNQISRKEENVLFNEALNSFYLRLYSVRHMVKDHSDSERGNPLHAHGLLYQISSKIFFYMHDPTTG